MKANILIMAAAALMCAGCERIIDKEAAREEKAAAEEAAELARARFENRGKTVSGPGGDPATGKALTALLCSSPGLVEEIEGNMYLLEALSGPGNDPRELRRQRLELRMRYRTFLNKALPAHGSSYEEFAAYSRAMGTGEPSPEAGRALGALIKAECPGRDKDRIAKAAFGLMKCCESGKG